MSNVPWISVEARNFLDNIINKETEMFEWGSGGSTVYFAPKVKSITSIENDKSWFDKLNIKLLNVKNASLHYISFDEGAESKDVLNPNAYASNSLYFKHKVFKTYALFIDQYTSFDVIVIDGRSRISCVKHAIPKTKVGGYIMLDDSERNYYNPGKEMFNNDCWKTTIVKGKGSGTTHFFQKVK